MLKKTRILFIAALFATPILIWQFSPKSIDAGNVYADSADKQSSSAELAEAVFAGGCFWCVEKDFEVVPGVEQAISGYTGGLAETADYKRVASGQTDHLEAVLVRYDPSKVSYATLLQYFWRQINPTDNGGQFVDRGNQYRPAVFYSNDDQKRTAEASLKELGMSGRYDDPMAVTIEPLEAFYDAEDYHQDYYKKSPWRYKIYRRGSGRDQYLQRIWGDDLTKVRPVNSEVSSKQAVDTEADPVEVASSEQSKKGFSMPYTKPSKEELKERLTDIQYRVTQEDATERPFQNEYDDEKREGIYVDIVSGEPLFSSKDKYDSGTGWPSFSRPLVDDHIVTKTDYKLILPRTEVRSKYADSHLGHVFKDGPQPTGLRYCMNSAAMRFIPKEELAAEGYSEYVALFQSGSSDSSEQ